MCFLHVVLLLLEKDGLYHYWNPRTNQFQNVTIDTLFRSNYTTITAPQPPLTTLYTLIKLRTVFISFWIGYLLYGIHLTLIKNCINKDFKMASLGKKLQHIIEAVNMPEAFGDWDGDNTLNIEGHKKMWNNILAEMMMMVGFQFLTNMILITPFIITGTYIYQNKSLFTLQIFQKNPCMMFFHLINFLKICAYTKIQNSRVLRKVNVIYHCHQVSSTD